MITVKIRQDDQGQYSVGVDNLDVEGKGSSVMSMGGKHSAMSPESQEDAGMSPAKDLESALQIARDLLTNQQVPDQNEMWNRVQRDRAMEAQPGGPMMGRMK